MGPDINIAPQLTSTKEKSPEGFPPGLVVFLHQSLLVEAAPARSKSDMQTALSNRGHG
jgi:hypothetical protein